MASNPAVRVEGLRETRRALREVGGRAQREFKAEMLEIAEDIAADARGRVPKITGRAAGSYIPKGLAAGAAVTFGGRRAPYAPWLDFGGTTGPGHRPGIAGSGSVKRPVKPQGRYLYPSIRDNEEDIEERVGDVILGLARRHGFRTEGG